MSSFGSATEVGSGPASLVALSRTFTLSRQARRSRRLLVITRGRPQASASTMPAHNVMSDAPALRRAVLASSSSAGRALIGPGGSINFAAGTDVTFVDADDFPDSGVEVSRLAVLDGPEVHPTKTRDTTMRMAPMRTERDVLCLQSPSPEGGRILSSTNAAASSADFPPY